MKKLRSIILLIVLTFIARTSFSQTADSLGVYPNPFKDITTIHFEIVHADTITLNIYDRWGRTIKTYFQKTYLPSGSYSINFIADTLPDGKYVVAFKINSNVSIVKLVSKTITATSIQDIKAYKTNLHLSPNPTWDLVTIPFDGVKLFMVTDLNGRVIKSVRTEAKTLSLVDLEAGQYFVTVLTDKQEIVTTEKIIKIK